MKHLQSTVGILCMLTLLIAVATASSCMVVPAYVLGEIAKEQNRARAEPLIAEAETRQKAAEEEHRKAMEAIQDAHRKALEDARRLSKPEGL